MNKFLISVAIVGAGWYWFGPKSDLEILMAGEPPFIETKNSGIFDVRPSRTDDPDIRIFSESGRITLVQFYDEKCKPCRQMFGRIDNLSHMRPDVAIKLLHVSKNYYSIVGEHYGLDVPHVPFTVILDKEGEILASDDGHENAGYDLFYEWFNAERRRD